MNRGLSLYPDLLRTLAAFEVLPFHMRRFTPGMERAWWNQWGHETVVLFFMLSGYVITYAAETQRHRLKPVGTAVFPGLKRPFAAAR